MLMHDLFSFQAGSRGDCLFAVFEEFTVTYREAYARAQRLASFLAQQGLKKGDRFCLLTRNSIDDILLMYAGSTLGVVPVPLNYRLAPREWADIIADSESRLILAEPDYCNSVDAGLNETHNPPNLARVSIGDEVGEWRSLREALVFAESTPPAAIVTPEDPALQVYTSGTTGRPKGVVLSHRAIVSNMAQSTFSYPYKIGPGDRTLVALPLFHIAAIATSFSAISSGATLVVHREVDPVAIANALANDQIAVASLVPAIIQFLLVEVPGLTGMKFPHLKLLGYGASPIAESVLRRAMEVFNCHFVQGYGMTELAGSCAMLTEEDHRRALSGRPELLLSAGKALPGVELRVVGSDGADLPFGEIGEILVRGPQIMSGYWQQPEATAEALAGGWMHTGDAGYLDDEGYLYVRDRIKDMIVTGAENVYPAEVEAVLYGHPKVAEVAVIGVPDDRWGETVMAVVVAKPGQTLNEQELDDFCRRRLGGFKVPRKYAFVESLPRNPSGKVLKRELRKGYWPEQERQVH